MAAKNRRQKRKCQKKNVYATQQKAAESAHYLFRTKGERLWDYKCQFCGKYHIGHRSKRYSSAKLV